MQGGHGEGSIAQKRKVVTLEHSTALVDSDCNGVCGGDLIIWVNVVTTILLM